MRVEVVVHTVGKGIEEFFHPRRAFGVNSGGLHRIQKQAGPDIVEQRRFPFHLCQSANRFDVILFDTEKVVFALGIQQAKNDICIRFSIDMRDTPAIPDDGNALCARFPAGNFGGGLPREGSSGEQKSK